MNELNFNNDLFRSKQEVKQCLIQHSRELDALGVKRLGLFGISVQKVIRQDSEVQLLVEMKKGKKGFQNFIVTASFLKEILARQVNLLPMNKENPGLAPEVFQKAEFIIISSDKNSQKDKRLPSGLNGF